VNDVTPSWLHLDSGDDSHRWWRWWPPPNLLFCPPRQKAQSALPFAINHVGHSVSVWHFLFSCLEQHFREEVACAWSTVRHRAAVWVRKLYFCSVRLQMELHRIWLVLGYVGTGLNSLVPSYIGWYWVMLAGTGLYRIVPSCIGWYWVMLTGTGLYRFVPSYIGWYWVTLAGTGLYRFVPSYIGWYWVTLAGTQLHWLALCLQHAPGLPMCVICYTSKLYSPHSAINICCDCRWLFF
jgi:hypothetical protein